MQSRADALLLLMWNDPGEAGVYSGKIYEYIAVKRPIIYVGFPEGWPQPWSTAVVLGG